MSFIQLDLFPLSKGHGYTSEWYDESLLRMGNGYIFVFGDSAYGKKYNKGTGGQACIRHEPNAYGLVSKKYPSNAPSSFLYDSDPESRKYIDAAIKELYEVAATNKLIFPAMGIGTGLSRLPTYAPQLLHRIDTAVSDLLCLDYRSLR